MIRFLKIILMACFYFMFFYSMYKSFTKSTSSKQLASESNNTVIDYLFTKPSNLPIQPHRLDNRYPSLVNATLSVLWETPMTMFQIHNDISNPESELLNFEKTRHWRTGKVVGISKDPSDIHNYLVDFDHSKPTWVNVCDTVFEIIQPPLPGQANQLEANPLEANQLEANPLEANLLEANQLEANPLEANPLEANQLEANPLEANQLEANQLEANQLEANPLEPKPVLSKQEDDGSTDTTPPCTFADMIARKTSIQYNCLYNQYPEEFTSDIINSPITTLDQLIQLADDFLDFKILRTRYGKYRASHRYHPSIDFDKLVNTIDPLIELNNMVGMPEFKNNIMTHVMYHLQGLHGDEMNHIAIEGPPGVGKTTVGKILGKIYHRMGFLTSGKFKIVKSHDLIGQYIGQTAPKTQAVLDECRGGVLFIDEAYTIGNGAGKRDNYFGKDCIDTINQHLSENKNNFLLIVAGYGDQLDKNFFSINPGLERRFPWRYCLESYSLEELVMIFTKLCANAHWDLAVGCVDSLRDTFGTHFKHFKQQRRGL